MLKKRWTIMDKTVLLGSGAIVVAAALYFWLMLKPTDRATPVVNVAAHGAAAPKADSIIIPELSQTAQSGKFAFEDNCAACHGETLAGTDAGPPLIHELYVPGHHSDAAIVHAAKNGVTSHHYVLAICHRLMGSPMQKFAGSQNIYARCRWQTG